jgi:hypothetical protein
LIDGERRPRHWTAVAHTEPPDAADAHCDPAQHAGASKSQAAPASSQLPATGAPLGARQTVAEAGPAQVPSQQSSAARQGAPAGKQASRHASAPAPSTTQRPLQHCSPTLHALPAPAQLADAGGRQRSTPL